MLVYYLLSLGMLTPDEEDEPPIRTGRGRGRSLSIDSLGGAATASTQTQTARVVYTSASSTPGQASPVKITISKSPQGRTIVSQPGGQPPKVRIGEFECILLVHKTADKFSCLKA